MSGPRPDDPVIGVIGGSGGIGASTFAAVLAAEAAASVLVDVDAAGGGVDVLLGAERLPGVRWSGVRLGGGVLDPAVVRDGLPRWRDVGVLACDVGPPGPDGAAVGQLVEACRVLGPVVVDLGRSPSAARAAAVQRCRLVVLVLGADVGPLAAARAVRSGLGVDVPLGVLVRRGALPAGECARYVDARLLGELRPASRPVDPDRPPGRWVRSARGVLDGATGARAADRDRLDRAPVVGSDEARPAAVSA